MKGKFLIISMWASLLLIGMALGVGCSSSTLPAKESIAKPIIKFKHGKGSCSEPLGICIIIPFILDNRELTDSEIADGFGTADFQVSGDRLHMTFHREAALPDGTIPIEEDTYLNRNLSEALGYDSILLKTGNYKVDLSKSRFGETFVDIVKGERISSNKK